jgi:hypothetical protein
MGTPIARIDQVTPAWLTNVLRENGYLDRGEVVSVRPANVSSLAGGPGFSPGNILEVAYSDGAPPSAPSRLYVKAEQGTTHEGAGRREIEFYASIAIGMPDPPAVPCYDAAYEPQSGAYHLLLADVSQSHWTIESEAPAPKADTEQMIDTLARLHAHWWGHSRLHHIGLVDADLVSSQVDLPFSEWVDYLGDRLSVERRRIYEQVLASLPGLLEQRLAHGETLTIVHDDAHVWNFLLPHDPTRDRVYLVDWEQWGVSAGPHDVAYMLTLFWYPERRARMERDLVRRYHDRLVEHGVTGYDWDACWYDYRLFAARHLLVPLWAWTWAQRLGRRWGFHRWMQLEKALLAFEDLGCAEILG